MLALPYLATTPRHPVRRAEPRTCEQVSINGSPPAQSKLGGSGKEAQIKLRRMPNNALSSTCCANAWLNENENVNGN